MRRGWSGGLFLGFLFFISGFTGLVYEVIWAKYLALLLGSTAYAQVGVLAVFMGGLALGSAICGRWADGSAHPLLLYGCLEIGVGVSAALFALRFGNLSAAYWSALAAAGNTGAGAVGIKTLLCIVSMIAPTMCMGGTLPVLSRALGLQRQGFGRGVAYLYAVNSFGAASGAVLTGFVLLPRWGVDAPFVAAAAVNLLVGVAAILLDRRSATIAVPTSAPGPGEAGARLAIELDEVHGYRVLVTLCAAVSGAVAMIYEVAWIRLCSLVLGSSTYSFSIMLTAFIVGIAAGSLVYSLTDPARGRPLRFFAYSSLVSVALLLACLPFYDRLPFLAARLTWELRQVEPSFAIYEAANLTFCVVVMLPLTFMSGLNFPALAHASASAYAGVGRPIGYVLLANTAGTIIGTVASGLYLLPAYGLQNTFLLGCATTLLLVLIVLLCKRSVPRPYLVGIALAGGMAMIAYRHFLPPWDLRLLTLGEFRQHQGLAPRPFAAYRADVVQELVYYRDGASATVSVERWPDELVLRVNGKADASANGDRETQLLLGHLPAILHPGARRALIIGYGSGMTAGALLHHPLESVDVVEISPEVIEADAAFRPLNGNPLSDRRTQLFVEDARTFLYRSPRRYDLIISEPSNPWIAGVANLFTAEFFEQAKSRLADDGVLVQWFHTYETSNAIVALILRTITASFAEVRVFQPSVFDVMVIASPTALHPDRAAMQAAFAHASDLQGIGISRLSTLLGLEVLSPQVVGSILPPGSLNRDRLPLLEYAAPRAFFDGRNATLIGNVETIAAADFLQSADSLSIDELRDLVEYERQFDMLSFGSSLRFLSEWLTRDPSAAPLLKALAKWSSSRPAAHVLPALLQNVSRVEAAQRPQYLHALLLVLRSVTPRASVEQISSVVPLVDEVVRSSGDFGPLQQLGGVYFMAGAYSDALATFDTLASMPALPAERRATLQCSRAQALEALKRKDEAVTAFRACAETTDPTLRTQAEAALKHLQ
jgi:predicted membrane-bound spermidine synthase